MAKERAMEKKGNRLTVLVTGATGRQGGHVSQLLLKKGHTVHAFTRNTQSPGAKKLAQMGANLVKGDFQDRRSLEAAFDGVDCVFAMSTPFEVGVEMETKQGMELADVAKLKKKYLVFTSVAAANRNTGIPFFESKWKVEQHIKKLGIESVVVAPAYFMENLITYWSQGLKEGLYRHPFPPDKELPQSALDDIAAVAVLALENKERFLGKRLAIASEVLTGNQVAEILSRVLHRPIQYQQIPMEQVEKTSKDLATMFRWALQQNMRFDLAPIRRELPEIKWHTYEQWAKEQNWDAVLGLAAAGRASR
jgi:uncharacterized protein YbjT (DUF2867 family)